MRLRHPTRRIRFRLALDELDRAFPDTRPVVLDAGCSEGLLAELVAARHPDWPIDAVDADADVVKLAAVSLAAAGADNVRAFEADLTKPLGTERYDAVLAFECLHLILDDDAVLTSLAAAAKPGGLLLAHVPVRSWVRVSRIGRTVWPGEVRSGYTPEELTDKLVRAGFRDVGVTLTCRSLARFGSEVDAWLAGGLAVLVWWYPISVAIAWLDRHGVTWGPATSFLVHARR
jgi:trans-aconitate methyltransferase